MVLEHVLGYKQFYPMGSQNSSKQTLCQFLSPQTNKMKSGIISSILTGPCIHAIVTIGVGICSLYDERVIHFGVACTTSLCGKFPPRKWKSRQRWKAS